ncbi:MAG: mechanosensitive ion channel [Sulfolobaceae archaeon]
MTESKKVLNSKTKIFNSIFKLIISILLFIIILAFINVVLVTLLKQIYINIPYLINQGLDISPYLPYINTGISILFGYLIINSFSEVIYWNLRLRYDHSTSHSVRNLIRIIGIGALAATIAGSTAGGTAGVALGGFLGIVIGFATQQILGQAIAGLFLLIARPFKIGDVVTVAGDTGKVEDITTLFTFINKGDQIVLIPNNSIIGNKIYILNKR